MFDGNSLLLSVCVCVRLLAMTREAKMKELEMLDAARRKFMNFTQQQKEAELARLDDEIRQKVCQRRVLCSVFWQCTNVFHVADTSTNRRPGLGQLVDTVADVIVNVTVNSRFIQRVSAKPLMRCVR